MARTASNKPKPSGGQSALSESNHNSAIRLLLASIAMRLGTVILRKGVETTLMRVGNGKDAAAAQTNKRSFGLTIASLAIAKIGSKSIPGAALVGGGLVIKALFDRSKARQAARKGARDAGKANDQSAD